MDHQSEAVIRNRGAINLRIARAFHSAIAALSLAALAATGAFAQQPTGVLQGGAE